MTNEGFNDNNRWFKNLNCLNGIYVVILDTAYNKNKTNVINNNT